MGRLRTVYISQWGMGQLYARTQGVSTSGFNAKGKKICEISINGAVFSADREISPYEISRITRNGVPHLKVYRKLNAGYLPEMDLYLLNEGVL